MMKKGFIRLNVNDEYLSFGNFFRVIKEQSNHIRTFWQSDLFSILFNTDTIADSTVNNYCTGLRAINPTYKNAFMKIKNDFENDHEIFVPILSKILVLLGDEEFDNPNVTIESINQNTKLKHICTKLYSISKNDSDVSMLLSNTLYKNLHEDNLYDFIAQVLFYVILEKKQPIYLDDSINDVIEKNIYDTNISVNDIQDFIKIQLNSGIWSIRGIKELTKKNNPFACFEIASMECYGIITGKARYEKAYEYYKISAEYNHPVANWAIGYLYYKGHIGTKSKRDLFLAFQYFNKARKLKCSNAFNSIGLMMLNGDIPHIKKNKEKAIEMFKKAISMGNIYAYNNLGIIYENEQDYQTAFDYYLSSANAGESWACNKIGEFYRTGKLHTKDLKKAFDYYSIAIESPKFTLCPWSKYNLAKYFYKDGCLEIGIEKNIDRAIELLSEVSSELIEALEELIYIYYELYISSNQQSYEYFEKLQFYIDQMEKHPKYTSEIALRMNTKLKNFHRNVTHIELPN